MSQPNNLIGVAITKSDSTIFPKATKGLVVASVGDVKVDFAHAGGGAIEVWINEALGTVVKLNIVAAGKGYSSAPTITIVTHPLDSTGTGATATCTIDTVGQIATTTITNAGTGYTRNPTVTLTLGKAGVIVPKLAAGVIHDLCVTRVYSTGTEPTIITGLF